MHRLLAVVTGFVVVFLIACGVSTSANVESAAGWADLAAQLVANEKPGFPSAPPSRPPATRLVADERREALMALQELARVQSEDGPSWRDAGIRLLEAGEVGPSVTAFRRAVDLLGYRGELAMYNLACAYSLQGDREGALAWLGRAVASGYDNVEKIRTDPDLDLLRSDSRYQQIAESARILSMRRFFGKRSRYPEPGGNWSEAVEIYSHLVEQTPTSGRAWFNLGYSLHYAGHSAEAVQAFRKALDLGYRPPVAMYNIACAYSRINARDSAFLWLERAADAGFSLATFMTSDPDMENLRSDPRFLELAQIGTSGWA